MGYITIRTVAVKAFFVICVFLFVRDASQYHLVPVFYALGSLFAVVFAFWHLSRSFEVRFCSVSLPDILGTFRSSAFYFVSRIASTFYNSLNTLIMGLLFPGSVIMGQYTACNNMIVAGRNVSSPIADSLFPYMVRTKNYRLMFKIIAAGEVILIPICLLAGFYSEEICALVFGDQYRDAAPILMIMLPLIPISLLSFIVGFPALSPIGLASVANKSVIVGAVIQVALLTVLGFAGQLNVYWICGATLITECAVVVIRCFALFGGLMKIREEKL